MSDDKSLNRLIVHVGSTRSARRASIIRMFEAVHGRPCTADELADLDRRLDKHFLPEADHDGSDVDQAKHPRTDDDFGIS